MTDEQINEIADSLDCGLRCFVHKENADIKCIPDERQFSDGDLADWEEERKEIKRNRLQYIEIEGMTAHEEFGVMEEFIHLIDQKWLQEKLVRILSRPKPFRNFKAELDNSGPYWEKWFAFKRTKMLEWVKSQLQEKSNLLHQ